jgi:hypothetical protein
MPALGWTYHFYSILFHSERSRSSNEWNWATRAAKFDDCFPKWDAKKGYTKSLIAISRCTVYGGVRLML